MKQQVYNCLKRFDQIVRALQIIRSEKYNQSTLSGKEAEDVPIMNSTENRTNQKTTISESL